MAEGMHITPSPVIAPEEVQVRSGSIIITTVIAVAAIPAVRVTDASRQASDRGHDNPQTEANPDSAGRTFHLMNR
jgi:hypothetical protein